MPDGDGRWCSEMGVLYASRQARDLTWHFEVFKVIFEDNVRSTSFIGSQIAALAMDRRFYPILNSIAEIKSNLANHRTVGPQECDTTAPIRSVIIETYS
jgi:hypothetical protein